MTPRSTGLTRCSSKPASRDARLVARLAVAGERDQADRARRRQLAQPARQLVAVHDAAGRCRAARRRAGTSRASSSAAGPSCATATSWPSSARATSAQHLGGVLVVVDDEDARRRGPRRRRRRLGGTAVGGVAARSPIGAAAAARRTRCRGPARRCAPRRCRRAARPGCARSRGRGRGRPASGRAPARSCTNRSKTRGSISGAMPMPVSRTRDARTSLAVALRADRRCGRRVGVYLAALVSRFATTCASRVGSPSTDQARAARRPSGGASRCSSSGLAISIALRDDLGELDAARVRSSILPRVMRETSSRSSTRRTRCSTWRSMTARSLGARRVAAQLHQLQRGQDRRQRIAQLVAEHREELVLRAVRLLGVARAPPRPACLCAPARFELRLDARHQLARRERLDQVVVGAGVEPSTRASSPARADSMMTGTSRSAVVGAHAAQQAEAVEPRHHHVGEDQVGRLARGGGQRLRRRRATASTSSAARAAARRSRACRRCRRRAGSRRAAVASAPATAGVGASASTRGSQRERLLRRTAAAPSTAAATRPARRRSRSAGRCALPRGIETVKVVPGPGALSTATCRRAAAPARAPAPGRCPSPRACARARPATRWKRSNSVRQLVRGDARCRCRATASSTRSPRGAQRAPRSRPRT